MAWALTWCRSFAIILHGPISGTSDCGPRRYAVRAAGRATARSVGLDGRSAVYKGPVLALSDLLDECSVRLCLASEGAQPGLG
jgi:hypothetical protein